MDNKDYNKQADIRDVQIAKGDLTIKYEVWYCLICKLAFIGKAASYHTMYTGHPLVSEDK